MRKIRETVRRRLNGDAGITMIEVVVALMVFSLIAVGMSYSIFLLQKLRYDNERRAVATALASGEIDRVLAIGDPFEIPENLAKTARVDSINGTNYQVITTSSWNTDSAADRSACGTSGGNLLHKTVSVEVKWDNMLLLKKPVTTDTLVAPTTRLTAPGMGTILIAANREGGEGSQGVTVTVAPVSGGGGAAVASVPLTNASGCSYALRVQPGTYRVTMQKTDFVDTEQVAVPVTNPAITVRAGETTSVKIQYDQRVRLETRYRTNDTGARLPSTLDTTYFAASRIYSYSTTDQFRNLHPWRSGYTAVTGKYVRPSETDPVGCTNVSPAAWAEGEVEGRRKLAGVTAAATATAPGDSGRIDVTMGIVNFRTPPGVTTVIARTAAPSEVSYPGDPGCTSAMEYRFTGLSSNTNYRFALPWGSWKLSSTSGPLNLTGIVTGLLPGQGALMQGVVTLDPRADG